MPEEEVKTNHLTIYMIKSTYQQLEDIVDISGGVREIEGGRFVFEESQARTPEWVSKFFGSALSDDIRLFTSSAKGVFIIPVTRKGVTTNFAISFGTGRFLLKDGVVVERFGLKVVLNSVDQKSFKSIDKTTLGTVPKHSKEQMGKEMDATEFGIDIEQDLISAITATSKDPLLGKTITGKDSLVLSVKKDSTTIKELLEHCINRFESEDYKINFDWIDQISELRNPHIESTLNLQLLERINTQNFERLWMAIPEVVDWTNVLGFRYMRAVKADLNNDLDIQDFVAMFGEGKVLAEEHLKHSDVYAISVENGGILFKWTAFKCIYSEIELGGKFYILNNGKWYEIASNFVTQVKDDFNAIPDSTIVLPDYTSGRESVYNLAATTSLTGSCCMDAKNISYGGGHSQIEFCDILTADKKIIHIKKYGNSSVLSHLFSQGAVSGELFVSDPDFRAKLNIKLPTGHKLANPRSKIDPREYEIVYGVISKSTDPLDIPFFSKVTMRNAKRRLGSFGYSVTKKKINIA